MAVARQFVREGPHVAGALHVVLAAQRVHAHARAADVAGQHGKVGDADDGGRALAVFGDAQTVVDRAPLPPGHKAGLRREFLGRRDAGEGFHPLGRVAFVGGE